MNPNVMQLNDSNFNGQIQKGVTLVDFWAPWCGPCRMQGPIVDMVAQQVDGKAKVAKLNVDDSPATAAAYGVRSIPTLLVFRDGRVVQQFVGVRDQQQLVEAIEKAYH